ncbi:unnamed protein product [Cuscuta campestris]|uniref:Uncharacterized protein n=1 Tax=Cuscuta campestris TaxID=132261 RepID=A0A484KSN0_9ASTE|nr:unnamed protein product [Cuscuta campestris]
MWFGSSYRNTKAYTPYFMSYSSSLRGKEMVPKCLKQVLDHCQREENYLQLTENKWSTKNIFQKLTNFLVWLKKYFLHVSYEEYLSGL